MAYFLKKLAARDLEAALAKASTYRDLNQPEEAESICRDVLDIDGKNQLALRLLGLAITDRFPSHQVGLFEEARAVFARLESEYERVYYEGIAWERCGKAHLERSEAHSAFVAIEQAMVLFERAETMGPKDSPDAILRYNRCVRLFLANPELGVAESMPRVSIAELGD
jgi:tetratricopeptide (TPR) repeat protein